MHSFEEVGKLFAFSAWNASPLPQDAFRAVCIQSQRLKHFHRGDGDCSVTCVFLISVRRQNTSSCCSRLGMSVTTGWLLLSWLATQRRLIWPPRYACQTNIFRAIPNLHLLSLQLSRSIAPAPPATPGKHSSVSQCNVNLRIDISAIEASSSQTPGCVGWLVIKGKLERVYGVLFTQQARFWDINYDGLLVIIKLRGRDVAVYSTLTTIVPA